MRRKSIGWLAVLVLCVSISLLVTAACSEEPTPGPTVIKAPPIVTPLPVATTVPPVVSPTKPAATVPPTAKPTTPAPPAPVTLKITEPLDESVLSTSPVRVSGTTALDAQVSVNGVIVPVEDSGMFSISVDLFEGPNLLEITASNLDGSTANQILTVIYLP